MKNVIVLIAGLLIAGQAHAGSYNYDCNAIRVSSEGDVQTLKFNREGGTLNELGFSNETISEDIRGNLEFLLKKKSVKVKVEQKSIIRDYKGNLGAREHYVTAIVADIKVIDGKRVIKFTGTCVEETVTTCGGDCFGGEE